MCPVRCSWRGVQLYTVGPSTRTLGELVTLLRAFDIAVVADIRTIPRSRHNPQFNGDALGLGCPRFTRWRRREQWP